MSEDEHHEPLSYSELARALGEDTTLITQAYQRTKDTRESMDYEAVVTLLGDLSVELGLDLAPAAESFAVPRLDEDPEDVIDLRNIQLEAVARRLRKFCLSMLAETAPEEGRISPREKDVPDADIQVESGEPQEPDSDLPQEEVHPVDPDPISINKTHRRQISHQQIELPESLRKIKVSLEDHKDALQTALFHQDPSVLATAVMRECGFKVSAEAVSQLEKALAAAFPLASSEQDPITRFQELETAVLKWAETVQIPDGPKEERQVADPLTQKLQESIADFQSMRETKQASGEDVGMLDNVLKALKQQLSKLTQNSTEDGKLHREQLFHEKCARTIREVFHFYSNQLRLLGKTPSFESIQRNSSTWNISKFTRFCRDFGLLLDKPKRTGGVKTVELTTVKTVFAKNAVLQKEMDEGQFPAALDMLAHMYFDQDYDRINGTDVSSKTTDEKRDMLYRFLQFDTGNECLKRAKGFGLPFTSKTDNRIPENDPGKRYKFKPYPNQRMTLEEWRQVKNSSVPRESQPIAKDVTPPKRAPVDAIVSYSTQPPQMDSTYVSGKYATKARNPYTWKTLGELQPEEILGREEDFDLNNLIAEDSSDDDEMLKRQYPLAASQPNIVVSETPLHPTKTKEFDAGKTSKFSTPQMAGIKANALIKSESRPNLEQITRQMMLKTKEMSVSDMKKEKEQMQKVMKVTEAQRARGDKVLGRLRQSAQFA